MLPIIFCLENYINAVVTFTGRVNMCTAYRPYLCTIKETKAADGTKPMAVTPTRLGKDPATNSLLFILVSPRKQINIVFHLF